MKRQIKSKNNKKFIWIISYLKLLEKKRMSNWSYIITMIFLFFTIILIYLKKYNHLLIIILPYLTIVFFTDIQNTNQGKEILDLFFIFLLMLYSLISIISKILDKYKSSILIASGNIISISVIWCLILLLILL